MRRRFPYSLWVAILVACLFTFPSRAAEAEYALSRGVSDLVFHLTTYDENSVPLKQGQGLVVGSGGAAIVSVSTLEGAARAVATMMDGTTAHVREVHAVDEASGLAKIGFEQDAPMRAERLIESGAPQVNERIIFSGLTTLGSQVCVECVIKSIRTVPAIQGLYYVETSQPVPLPGGGVFGSDGRLVGIVIMRFGSGYSGLVASNERLSTLASQLSQKTSLDAWTRQRNQKWSDMTYARYMRGQIALWQGQPDTTLDLLEDHVGSFPPLKSDIAALLGEAYLTEDLLPEAIFAFRFAIDAGSPPDPVYSKLAWTYMETGQYVLSEKLCYEAILIDPDSPGGYTLIAHLRNLQGDYKQAVYEARRALMRNPDCPCAHFERGIGYIGLGKYDSAVKSLITATTLDPEYAEAFNSLGYAYLRMDQPLHAIVVLKEAAKLEPEMVAAWDNLGEAYSKVDLPGKAIAALRLAVCLEPSRSHLYCRLAREFIKQGLYQEAAALLTQGLDQCEESQWLVYYLGKAFVHEGRIDLAREQAELLVEKNKELGGQLLRIINSSTAG